MKKAYGFLNGHSGIDAGWLFKISKEIRKDEVDQETLINTQSPADMFVV